MAARRAGKDPASIGPVLLVPELCTRTGQFCYVVYLIYHYLHLRIK